MPHRNQPPGIHYLRFLAALRQGCPAAVHLYRFGGGLPRVTRGGRALAALGQVGQFVQALLNLLAEIVK
jgi:hypothetical protein